MDLADPVYFRRRLIERLGRERSARFTSWVSLGEAADGSDDLNATGTTDFLQLESRTRQRRLSAAVLRDGELKKQMGGFVNRVVVGAGVWAVGRLNPAEQLDCFYGDGRRWERANDDVWAASGDQRPGFRAGQDPTLVLESLAAISGFDQPAHREVVAGHQLTRVRVVADLRIIEGRLSGLLDIGEARARTSGWWQAAPVTLWIDESGLLRRISYAPLAPNTHQPLWWTLQLFDFGTPVPRPQLPQAADQPDRDARSR